MKTALRQAVYQRACDYVRPNGNWVGIPGSGKRIRVIPTGGLAAAEGDFDRLSVGATLYTPEAGRLVAVFPARARTFAFRPVTKSPNSAAIEVNSPVVRSTKVRYLDGQND